MNSGTKLAALYSFMPNKLKLCGPHDVHRLLFEHALTGKKENETRAELSKFEAVYPYLRAIAERHGRDPLDNEVVEAYWLGNDLLEGGWKEELQNVICDDFGKLLPKKISEALATAVPEGCAPHHSFHVFHIQTITGRIEKTIENMDRCRISWGKVLEIRNDSLRVTHAPVIKAGKKLEFGEEIEREIELFAENGEPLVHEVRKGVYVSSHWGLALQILSDKQKENLERWTRRTINAVNH